MFNPGARELVPVFRKDVMKELKLEWITDPGHGWLAVSGNPEIVEIARRSSTGYDYTGAGIIYLEEDCSVGVFARAMRGQLDELIRNAMVQHTNEESYVRELPRLAAGDLGLAYLGR